MDCKPVDHNPGLVLNKNNNNKLDLAWQVQCVITQVETSWDTVQEDYWFYPGNLD